MALPSWLMSFSPSGRMSVTVALAMSTLARALFSCSTTQAVAPSASSAMYSGSRSWAVLAPGPKIRTPWSRSSPSWPLKAVKSAVAATGFCGSLMSTTLTEPSGSTL